MGRYTISSPCEPEGTISSPCEPEGSGELKPSKIFFSRMGSPMILKLYMQHQGLKLYKVYINDDP